jgi:hypothetical protein
MKLMQIKFFLTATTTASEMRVVLGKRGLAQRVFRAKVPGAASMGHQQGTQRQRKVLIDDPNSLQRGWLTSDEA